MRTPLGSSASAGRGLQRRSMAHRKAARVLPVPVGASIRVWWPALTWGQPACWTRVGASKVAPNQARVAGVNGERGIGRD